MKTLCSIALLALFTLNSVASGADQPNILFIMSDTTPPGSLSGMSRCELFASVECVSEPPPGGDSSSLLVGVRI